MMIINWKITMCALVGTIPIFLCTRFLISFYVKIAKEIQEEKAKLGNVIQECMGNVRTVKAFAGER
jgi:ABC-type multidrug transport system fused ATPase/permease subunit